jgi:ribulose kinase
MNQFMVEVSLPEALTQEFILLIPGQRQYIDDMFNRGVISNYTLAMDRSKLWVTMVVQTVKDVRQIMDDFPIADYIEYTVHQLAFSNSASAIIPEISLN